jgi:hypothetical protein
MHTPWGQSDSIREVADGIMEVSTPGHGGIWLSDERQKALPAEAGIHNWLKGLAWWEEDCDWCIPYLVFADEYKAWDERNGMGEYFATNMTNAIKTASIYHPEFHEWYMQRAE